MTAQQKKVLRIAACITVLGILCIAAVMIPAYRSERKAEGEGYDQMQSLKLRGSDGKQYTVDVYWDRLKSIPGEHRVMARTWVSTSNYVQKEWMSGNRSELHSIHVMRTGDADRLIFRYREFPGSRKIGVCFTGTVSRTGLAMPSTDDRSD